MNANSRTFVVALFAALSFLAACSGPTRHPVEGGTAPENKPAPEKPGEPETPKEPANPVWTKRVVITTGVHGNEPGG